MPHGGELGHRVHDNYCLVSLYGMFCPLSLPPAMYGNLNLAVVICLGKDFLGQKLYQPGLQTATESRASVRQSLLEWCTDTGGTREVKDS
jgi:hypothetical protein